MRSLNRFEYNLVSIARALVGQLGVSRVRPMLMEQKSRPGCLTRGAVDLVREALGKGLVLLLARPQPNAGAGMSGGWSRARFLRNGKMVHGRLWERTSPQELGLVFSPHSLDFLIWLTAAAAHVEMGWEPVGELTPGDRLLIFLAYRQFRTLEGFKSNWPKSRLVAENGMCQLAYPQDFSETKWTPHFEPWVAGPLSCVVEVWQKALGESWQTLEQRKGTLVHVTDMVAQAKGQERVLEAYLLELERRQRRDLARFILQVSRDLLQDDPPPDRWTAKLNLDGLRIRERMEVYRAAFSFLRALEKLNSWQQQARGIGYFDEGYSAAQAWQAEWEAMQGDLLWQRARTITQAYDPLTSPSAVGGGRSDDGRSGENPLSRDP